MRYQREARSLLYVKIMEIDLEQNLRNMRQGELYYAFTPDLVKRRARARKACAKFNDASEGYTRRHKVELWKK